MPTESVNNARLIARASADYGSNNPELPDAKLSHLDIRSDDFAYVLLGNSDGRLLAVYRIVGDELQRVEEYPDDLLPHSPLYEDEAEFIEDGALPTAGVDFVTEEELAERDKDIIK